MSTVKLTTTGGGGGTVSLAAPASTGSDAQVVLTLPQDDGTANQVLKTDGSGNLAWVAQTAAATNTPAFSVHKGGDSGSAQSIPHWAGSWTKVTWSHEFLDTDNCFASDKFTPTSAGWYWFNVNLLMNFGEAEDEYASIALHKNGSAIFQARSIEGVGTMSQSLKANFMAEANGSGDYFEIFVNQFSGDARNIDENELCTWWNGFKLIGLS
tara:strand:+ start:63 stop:695 length:633 start_codon:yes stop_codon:yes gene_type:complete